MSIRINPIKRFLVLHNQVFCVSRGQRYYSTIETNSNLSGKHESDEINDSNGIRLAKLMAQKGLCSRREADAYIAAGAVIVNGKKVSPQTWLKVPLDSHVELNFPAKRHQRKKVTILLNKPLGIVSSQPEDGYLPAVTLLTKENECKELNKIIPRGRNISELDDPRKLPKLAVCGRLDVNSTGLLLFTQDGTIAKKLLDPKEVIEKEYLVRVNKILHVNDQESKDIIQTLCRGITTENGITYTAKSVEVLNENQLRFILTSGKKRHIRHMCDAVGLQVVALKRVRIGGITLGHLPLGQWRFLQPTDRL